MNHEITIVGIRRGRVFSPNSEHRDDAIFTLISQQFTAKGINCITIAEEEFSDLPVNQLVYSMARGHNVIKRLCQAEMAGNIIINSPQALTNNNRISLANSFAKLKISTPLNCIYNLSNPRSIKSYPFWIKGINQNTTSQNDVVFVESPSQFENILHDLLAKNVESIYLENHIEGDLIKFYGIANDEYFHWHYPTIENGFSKFNLEKINGKPHLYSFDTEKLKNICNLAAVAANLTIYGGDAIITKDGNIVIIDFNDWPSFYNCRHTASKAIVTKLLKYIQK